MQRYYFDHNATTPVAPEVLEAMLPALTDVYGNASSVHQFGQAAQLLVDRARTHVARMLGSDVSEIIFTSGGTEADNLAVFGASAGGHVITTTVEHPAVLGAVGRLPNATLVAVDGRGRVDPDDIRKAIRPDTALISVMHANNELGTVQPLARIAQIAAEEGVVLHSDGVQAAGKISMDAIARGAALYSISGHKIGAPKGVGALYVSSGTRLDPMLYGGRQQGAVRPGTENVAGAVALGRAAQWVVEHGEREAERLTALRDRLEQTVLDRIADCHINGAGAPRVGNTSNLRFDGIDSDALLIALDLRGFAVSSGAACSSGAPEPSHVLLAIGLTREQARSSIRVSLGRNNTQEQVDALLEALVESVAHLRKLSPAYA